MGERFGKYELVRKIAVGGMAEIFLATHTGPEGFRKHVAIKRILPHLTEDTDFVTMFLDEARLVARFSHPNLVQIFELGQVKNVYFLAMEYVNGASMSRVLKTCQKDQVAFPMEYGVKICSFACEGLEYAHNFTDPDGTPLNLIHRDVSPQNIMLSYDGVVKVLDFGIAKAAGNLYRTRTTSLKGKAAYMSPEQITQKTGLDRRSDIFALGIVLYEFTTGRRPFEGDTELELMMGIVQNDPVDPRQHRSDMPDSLAEIILTALRKDRRQRFQSAREMRAELEKYLLGQQALVDSYELSSFARQVLPPGQTPVGYSVPTPSHPSLADQIEEALRESKSATPSRPGTGQGSRPAVSPEPVVEPGLTGARPLTAPLSPPEDAPTMLTPSGTLRPVLDQEPATAPEEPSRTGAEGIPRSKMFILAGLLVLVAVAGALAAYLAIGDGDTNGNGVSPAVVAAGEGPVAGGPAATPLTATGPTASKAPAAASQPATANRDSKADAGTTNDDTKASADAAAADPQVAVAARAQPRDQVPTTTAPAARPAAKRPARSQRPRHRSGRKKATGARKTTTQKNGSGGRRQPDPPQKKQPAQVAMSTPRAEGSLMVQSHPWTNVKVDGASYGATPWQSAVKLKPGPHLVQLSNPDGILYREKIVIQSGQTFTLRKRFRKGLLKVFVKPFGEVYVNGSRRGITPLTKPLELYEGRHNLRVYCPRTGKEFKKRIVIRPGDTVVEKIDLR